MMMMTALAHARAGEAVDLLNGIEELEGLEAPGIDWKSPEFVGGFTGMATFIGFLIALM